jgi:formylglycine-generating enzyme required for sulfatase activity
MERSLRGAKCSARRARLFGDRTRNSRLGRFLISVLLASSWTKSGWGADYPVRVRPQSVSSQTSSNPDHILAPRYSLNRAAEHKNYLPRRAVTPTSAQSPAAGETARKHPRGSVGQGAVSAHSSGPLADSDKAQIAAPMTIVMLASDPGTGRTRYEQIGIESQQVAPTGRLHALHATCIGTLKDQKGLVLLTNPPEPIDLLKNGDSLNVTAPLCTTITEPASASRVTMSLRKTGVVPTNMLKPGFQYIIFGEVLSGPTKSSPPDSNEAFRDCDACPEMLRLPGGTFSMGSAANSTEQPVHDVAVLPFALARSPVTVAQWRQCVVAGVCSYEPIRDGGSDNTPVHDVSWDDARQYVSWISGISRKNYRLPTEAEWEYAARAGSSGNYWCRCNGELPRVRGAFQARHAHRKYQLPRKSAWIV